jgi:hypothetical protein
MKTASRVRNRRHRCYELANGIMLEEPGADKFKLVHGIIHGWVGHAWIEVPGDQVYDPVRNTYTLRRVYAITKQAVVEKRYTKKQAARAMLKHHHHGPWHTER